MSRLVCFEWCFASDGALLLFNCALLILQDFLFFVDRRQHFLDFVSDRENLRTALFGMTGKNDNTRRGKH